MVSAPKSIRFTRQTLQFSLRNPMSQEPTSTETVRWRFECVLAEAQYSLERQLGIIAHFEDAVDQDILSLKKLHALRVDLEQSETMRKALKLCMADDTFGIMMEGVYLGWDALVKYDKTRSSARIWPTCRPHARSTSLLMSATFLLCCTS